MVDVSTEHGGEFPYRMKDLCELTGMPRQQIHFYIQQGLVPPGKKTGRNMAWYGPKHVERLELIRRLQHDRFLPLKAIKAVIDGREDRFDAEQEAFLKDVKDELRSSVAYGTDTSRQSIDATDLLEQNDVTRDELEKLAEMGIMGVSNDEGDRPRIAADDAWVLELFGRMRNAGFSRELGFTVEDLGNYVEAVDKMFERDTKMLSSRLSGLPPVQVARMIERALPVIHEFMVRYHASRVRDFFSSM